MATSELGFFARYDVDGASGYALADEPLDTSLIRYGVINNAQHVYDQGFQQIAACASFASTFGTQRTTGNQHLFQTPPFLLRWQEGGRKLRGVQVEIQAKTQNAAGGDPATITVELRPESRLPDPAATGGAGSSAVGTISVSSTTEAYLATTPNPLQLGEDDMGDARTFMQADDGDGELGARIEIVRCVVDVWGQTTATAGDLFVFGYAVMEVEVA